VDGDVPNSGLRFGGIPLVVSPFVMKGEVWLLDAGVKTKVMCHEGPQSGEEVEVWLRKAIAIRIITGLIAESMSDALDGKITLLDLPKEFPVRGDAE